MIKLNFEDIANNVSRDINSGLSKTTSLSRCDYVFITENEIIFVEKTSLSSKDLTNFRAFVKETIENVKKMWGSLVVFTWYASSNVCINELSRGKERIYVILIDDIDGRTARFLSNMIKTLYKYRNGSFSEIKFSIKSQ
ncbi:hypothetical protein [Aquifex sp.]